MNIKDLLLVAFIGGLCLLASPSFGGSIPECGFDVQKVYDARKSGVPKQYLLDYLDGTTDIPAERKAFIRSLIDDVYSKSADDFADDAFPACGTRA